MTRLQGSTVAGLSVAALLLNPSCGMKQQAISGPDDTGNAVSVDVADLWNEEAAKDPIISYKVRLAGDPDNPGLHNNLGNAYVLRNRMEQALAEFRTAAELDPSSPIPWNNLGTVYKKIGKLAAARRALEKAIKIDERYALAYYNLGTVFDDMGKYNKAIETYLKALQLQPELAEVRFNPQVVNNEHLMVVKLRHFLEESGNIALPLDELPE